MIGRAPILPPSSFAPASPPGRFSPPRAATPPPARSAGPVPSWQQPAVPNRPAAPPAEAPRPVVRAQSPEEPRPAARPAPLVMPTPEQLGVTCARPSGAGSADWTAARRRLDELGAACFQLEKVSAGGYRFVCLLPAGQPSRTHRVEAQAATEAEAVRLALERAEQYSGAKK